MQEFDACVLLRAFRAAQLVGKPRDDFHRGAKAALYPPLTDSPAKAVAGDVEMLLKPELPAPQELCRWESGLTNFSEEVVKQHSMSSLGDAGRRLNDLERNNFRDEEWEAFHTTSKG